MTLINNEKKINILVITKSPWSDINALGNTYSNFFSKWEHANFINLYLREELPDNEVCNKYYNITEKQIFKNLFRPSKIGRTFKKDQLEIMKTDKKYYDNAKREKSILDFFKNHRSVIFHILRELIWKLGKWNSQKLANFVQDVDIIVTAASGPIYLQNITNYCLEKSNAKLVLFFSDDTYCYKNTKPLNYMYQHFVRTKIRKSVDNSSMLYGASNNLCKEYQEYFSKDIKPLYKGCSFKNAEVKNTYSSPLKIVYAGNLYYGRDQILAKLADEIVKINKNSVKINLEIYTTASITDEIDKVLNRGNSSRIMGSLPYEQIKDVLAAADIVLHVESFDQKQIKITRLSFSTKIIDCMQSGSCMMAIGPSGLASIDYLNNIPGPMVVTDVNKIGETLNNIIDKPNLIMSKAMLLNGYAKEKHDINTVRNNLQDDFRKIIQEDIKK